MELLKKKPSIGPICQFNHVSRPSSSCFFIWPFHNWPNWEIFPNQTCSQDETDFPLSATHYILRVFLQTYSSQEVAVTVPRSSLAISSPPVLFPASSPSSAPPHRFPPIILYSSHLLLVFLSPPSSFPLISPPLSSTLFSSPSSVLLSSPLIYLLFSTHLILLSFLLSSTPFLSSCPPIPPLKA